MNLNPLYLMLPAAVIMIIIWMLMIMLMLIIMLINHYGDVADADDSFSQVTCCYAFMLPVACPTNAIVYKASGSKIIMIMITINTKYFLATSIL